MLFRKPACDWLVVGLGNPGENYARTRHNAGFRAVDRLAAALQVKVDRAKFRGLTAQAVWQGQKLLLLKPQTFMNNSGLSVMDAARFYKLPPERVIVIFDDISLPVGRLRVRADGSAGGHNGIKNIIAHLGTDVFPRVKVGVGAPSHPDYDMVDWVIGSFSPQEKKIVDEALDRALDAAECIISRGVTEAQNRFN